MELNNSVPDLLFPDNATFILLKWHELKLMLTDLNQQLYSCLMAVRPSIVSFLDLLCVVIFLMKLNNKKFVIYPRYRSTQQN